MPSQHSRAAGLSFYRVCRSFVFFCNLGLVLFHLLARDWSGTACGSLYMASGLTLDICSVTFKIKTTMTLPEKHVLRHVAAVQSLPKLFATHTRLLRGGISTGGPAKLFTDMPEHSHDRTGPAVIVPRNSRTLLKAVHSFSCVVAAVTVSIEKWFAALQPLPSSPVFPARSSSLLLRCSVCFLYFFFLLLLSLWSKRTKLFFRMTIIYSGG